MESCERVLIWCLDDGEGSARGFLDRHEYGIDPTLRDHRADLQNNAVGISIGSTSSSRDEIRSECLSALDAGRLSLDDSGNVGD